MLKPNKVICEAQGTFIEFSASVTSVTMLEMENRLSNSMRSRS
ncbi:hypothetical protein [Chroococcidiopsis sp. TS-821]|nr:hypothetical protein [Chroococcidiopsis sp. TS-821]